MSYDEEKVQDAVLALLQLTARDAHGGAMTAWKSIDWSITDALHKQGYLNDPRNKNKSLTLTPEGAERSKRLFKELFGEP